MSQIKRRDPLIAEAIVILDEHYRRANRDISVAWNTLGSVYTDFIYGELARCMRSPRYYLENYHVIKSESDGLKTLHPFWDSQEVFYTEVVTLIREGKSVKVLVLKARQLGISEISQGLIFHRSIFNEAINTLIVAQDVDQADYLFTKSMRAYEYLPWWMRPEKRYGSKGRYLILDSESEERHGLASEIFVAAANKVTGVSVGKTIRCAHLSELSDWPNAKTLTEQIFPTMNAPDTLAILESTARGRRGFWYDFWKESVQKWGDGRWAWKPIFIEWFRCPNKYFLPIEDKTKFSVTNDEASFRERVVRDTSFYIPDEMFNWKRMKVEEIAGIAGDEFGFLQEYPATWMEAFQSSGICAFPKKKLQQVMDGICRPPRWFGELEYRHGASQDIKTFLTEMYDDKGFKLGPDGSRLRLPPAETVGSRFRVWEKPEPGERYYLAADVAYGIEGRGDFSCIQVLRIGRGAAADVQVAEWRGWIDPTPFGHVIVGVAKWYNMCEVAIEINGVGEKTYMEVYRALEYPNLFRWKHYDKIKNFYTNYMGWITNSKSRRLIITNMRERLVENTVRLYSYDLLNEMMDFGGAQEGDRLEGQDTNDDRVMAMMICLWCIHDADFGLQKQPSSAATGDGIHVFYVLDDHGRIIKECATRNEAQSNLVRRDEQNRIRIRAGWSIAERAQKVGFHNTDFSPVFDKQGPRQRMFASGIPSENIFLDNVYDPAADGPDDDWRSY